MITEDYVSFEVANLLKKKGFNELIGFVYSENGELMKLSDFGVRYLSNSECDDYPHWQFPIEGVSSIVSAPTLQMAMKWLRETHSILLMVDYNYECTDTSYCYKIYRLGEHGKPERVTIKGVSYDKDNNPTEHIVGWRDFELSYSDYGTYEEACEAGIRYCLENLI